MDEKYTEKDKWKQRQRKKKEQNAKEKENREQLIIRTEIGLEETKERWKREKIARKKHLNKSKTIYTGLKTIKLS